jgi:ribulose-5-phosphate 4-epimerase/fuculose-1-phosphate aldolase
MTTIGFEKLPSSHVEIVSHTEQQALVNLAACYRLMAHFRMTDIIYTHISARVPNREGEFLINPYGLTFDQVTASNLVKVDVDGNVISDTTGLGVSRGGFMIHSAVHMARPDVECVLHAHTTATMVVSVQEHGLLPLSQHAMFLHGRIRFFPYSGFFETDEERRKLAAALGDFSILMLRNHGPLVLGTTTAQAFNLMYYLERACQVQVAALSSGAKCVMPDMADVEHVAGIFASPNTTVLNREWGALIGMLNGIDPSYAN